LYYFLFSKNKIENKNFKIYLWGIPVFIILSFGPILRFIPKFGIPLPYYLVMPALGFIRTPSRLSIVVLLCISVTVAFIINSIKINNRKIKIFLGILAPAFILYEFWVPHGLLFADTSCSAVYSAIKNNNSVSVIVEMPIEEKDNDPINLGYLYFSTCHLKPIFNGYSGYFPANYGPDSRIIDDFPNQDSIDKLTQLKISYVLLHINNYQENKQKPLSEAVQQNNKLQIEYQEGKVYLIKIKN